LVQKEVSLRPRNPTARYSVLGHDLIMRVKQLGVGKRRSRLSIASPTAEEIRFDGCLDSSNYRPVESVGRNGSRLVVVLLVPRKRPGHAGRKEASGGGFQGLRVEEASGYRPKFRIGLERGIRSPELYLG